MEYITFGAIFSTTIVIAAFMSYNQYKRGLLDGYGYRRWGKNPQLGDYFTQIGVELKIVKVNRNSGMGSGSLELSNGTILEFNESPLSILTLHNKAVTWSWGFLFYGEKMIAKKITGYQIQFTGVVYDRRKLA